MSADAAPASLTPVDYAREVARYLPSGELEPVRLFAAPAVRVLELSASITDNRPAGEVLALAGALLRYLLLPSVCLSGDLETSPDMARLEQSWTRRSGNTRYLSALRELQRASAGYLSNGVVLATSTGLRKARRSAVCLQATNMIAALEVVVAHCGCSLAEAAEADLERMRSLLGE